MCDKKGFCVSTKCKKTIEKHLPPLRVPDKNKEEEWLIKSLPSDWTPNIKTSGIYERLMNKKKNEHEEAIEEMKHRREDVNAHIEKHMRLKAGNLKKYMEEVKIKCEELINSLNLKPDELLKLSRQIFDEYMGYIFVLQENTKRAIDDYNQYLQWLEKERSERYKAILKSTYKKLHMISYKLPYELQLYFEHEILEINQMILSNLRCYADLHIQLISQTENNTRLWTHKIDAKKENWKHFYRKNALEKLGVEKFNEEPEKLMMSTEPGKTASSVFMNNQSEIDALWAQAMVFPITIEDVDLWSIVTQRKITELDNAARQLVDLYKVAIGQIFNKYFTELHHLNDKLIEMGIADHGEIKMLNTTICVPLVTEIETKYNIEIADLEELWNSVVVKLQNSIHKTYKFLSESAHLWDLHFQRTSDARNIILKDLASVIDKNDSAVQAKEIGINMMIDSLRQESTVEKLDETLNEAIFALNQLKTTYNSHYNTEKKIVEKFLKFSTIESEILISELQAFLNANPRERDYDPSNMKEMPPVEINLENEAEQLIPKQMKMCEYQTEAVHNWMFGLWEAIHKYMLTCKDEIMERAATWVEENIGKIAKRLEVKLAFNEPRYQRIKYDIYEVRLAELQAHSERIEEHKAGIDREIALLKEIGLQFNNKYSSIFSEYNSMIKKIMDKLEKADTVELVNFCILDFNRINTKYSNELDECKEKFETLCKEKIECIKDSGMNFSKAIILFSEGGNYSHTEAKRTTRNLKKLDKVVRKKVKTAQKGLNKKFRRITTQLNNRIIETESRLTDIKTEIEFFEISIKKRKVLQNTITREVFNLKLDWNKIENDLSDLMKSALIKTGIWEFLDEFISKANDVISRLVEFAKYLFLPEPMPYTDLRNKVETTTTLVSVGSTASGKSYKKTKDKKSGKNPTTSKKKKSLENYSHLLYKHSPISYEKFMSKICCLIYSSFIEIQSDAMEFYLNHVTLKSQGKIPQTYEAFIEKLLSKYQYYHLQCELFWLDQVHSFIKLIHRLLNFISKYANKFLEKFCLISKKAYQTEHEDFVAKINEIKTTMNNAYKALHNKLKTLHGHPANRHLLNSLIQEMADLKNENKDSIVILLPEYRELQESNANIFENRLEEGIEQFRILKERATKELLNVKLIKQLENRLDFLEGLLRDEIPDEDEEEKGIVEFGLNKRLSLIKKDLKIPSEYRISVEHSKMLIENVLSNTSWDKNPLSPTDIFEYNNFPASAENNLDELLQYQMSEDYQTTVQACSEEIDEIEDTAHDDEIRWLNMWNSDVLKILDLYKVKYDFHV